MPLGGGEAGMVPTGVDGVFGVFGAALVAPFGSDGVAGMLAEEPLGNAGNAALFLRTEQVSARPNSERRLRLGVLGAF